MAAGDCTPSPPFPSKLVTFRAKDGLQREKRLVACGDVLQWGDGTPDSRRNIANPAPVYWFGKLLGFRNGVERYGIVEECCEYPIADGSGNLIPKPIWVEQVNWPPYGISKHLGVILHSTNSAPDLDCARTLLTYNSGTGHWTGSIGGLNIDANLRDAPGFDPSKWPGGSVAKQLFFNLSGCTTALDATVNLINVHKDPASGSNQFYGVLGSGNIYPFSSSANSDVSAGSCGVCANSRISLEFKGFCNRVRVGHLIGLKNGAPHYAVGGCCKPCPQAANCCSLYSQCNLHATITVSGSWHPAVGSPYSCGYTAVIPVPQGFGGGANCPAPPFQWGATWNNQPPGPNPCGSWSLCFKCDVLSATCNCGPADGLPVTRWTMRLTNTNPDNSCGGLIELTQDVCGCEPLEVSFGPATVVVNNPDGSGCTINLSNVTLHL